MKKAAFIFVAVALAAFGFAACGGDDDDEETTTAAETTATDTAGGAGGAAGTVEITAAPDGSFAFEQKTASAPAGSVEIAFDNPASLMHDVVLEDKAGMELGRTDLISKSTDSFTVELQAGSYTYFCSVPGHRQGGMEGTLTAK